MADITSKALNDLRVWLGARYSERFRAEPTKGVILALGRTSDAKDTAVLQRSTEEWYLRTERCVMWGSVRKEWAYHRELAVFEIDNSYEHASTIREALALYYKPEELTGFPVEEKKR